MVRVGVHGSDRNLKYHWVLQWCPKSRWTLKGKIKGSLPCSRKTLSRTPWTINQTMNQTMNKTMNRTMNRTKIHEPWAKPWTINPGLTLSTIRSSFPPNIRPSSNAQCSCQFHQNPIRGFWTISEKWWLNILFWFPIRSPSEQTDKIKD